MRKTFTVMIAAAASLVAAAPSAAAPTWAPASSATVHPGVQTVTNDDRHGAAFGVLSTLQLAPAAGSNGVSDLSRMLSYMSSHGGPSVTLAKGTEPFTGNLAG